MQAQNEGDPLAQEAARVQQVYERRRRPTWDSVGHEFGQQERERNLLELLRTYGCMPLSDKSILDVGCGFGGWIHHFLRWGARPDLLTGIDLRADALAHARALLPARVRLDQGNAGALPYPAGTFDIVLQSTMFTSVLDPGIRRRIASEMLRVLKPDGLIVWYDFLVDNPANPHVRGVPKREIAELFSGCKFDLRRVTLVPPVLRWVAPRSWFLAYVMSYVRPFCTHYLGVITRPLTRT
jgi:ubiquinone/menaquinone biosynthesis C-methylase UbiE